MGQPSVGIFAQQAQGLSERERQMSTRRTLRQSTVGLAESLGPSASEVASSLGRLNVRGLPRDSTGCALARCVWAIVGSERSVIGVAVTDRSIHIKRPPGRIPVVVRLPKPLRVFVRAFDSGCYPELVATVPKQSSERCHI
jgi:hypothetical protein